MLLTGNDHTIRGNHFHDLVYGGADAGAIYSGRDWTYRGQMIEHNLFENISKPWPVTQYCSSSVVVVVVQPIDAQLKYCTTTTTTTTTTTAYYSSTCGRSAHMHHADAQPC
jgi:hypothetical protein